MKENLFIVESHSGKIQFILSRTRWLLGDNDSINFPMGDAVGHAECRGRAACGHAVCRGRVACGNPSKAGEMNPRQLQDYYKTKIGEIPSKNASVFELLSIKNIAA